MTELLVRCLAAQTRSRLATAQADALVLDVAKLLGTTNRSLVVICDPSQRMVGIVTKTNIVEQIGSGEAHACRKTAADIMVREVAFCRETDLLSDVLSKMGQLGFVHLPVIDDEFRPIGIVNARDALRSVLADEVYEESLLRDYVMGVGYR